jgi:hypothetical protein
MATVSQYNIDIHRALSFAQTAGNKECILNRGRGHTSVGVGVYVFLKVLEFANQRR